MSLFQTVKSISTAELKEKLNGSIQLIDVRTPAEYQGGAYQTSEKYSTSTYSKFQRKTRSACLYHLSIGNAEQTSYERVEENGV